MAVAMTCVSNIKHQELKLLENKRHCRMKDSWLLSQHMFGWPAFRPRLYTVLVKDSGGYLKMPALDAIHKLYREPFGSVMDLCVAPDVLWQQQMTD